VGVDDYTNVGVEAVTVGFPRDRIGSDRPTRDLRLAWPTRRRALDRVDRSAVQGEPSKTASIPEIRGDPSARKVAIVLCL
jgi:hypothetical protein